MPEINPHTSNPSTHSTQTHKPQESVGVKWNAPEFDFYPKGNAWYWWSITITLLLLGFAIWQKNFLFAFFVVVAELLVLSWGSRKPMTMEFKLDEKGLTINGLKFYPYADLKSFGVSDMAPTDEKFEEIVIYLKRRMRTGLNILVPKDKEAEIVTAFSKKIAKVEAELSLLDALERFLRF